MTVSRRKFLEAGSAAGTLALNAHGAKTASSWPSARTKAILELLGLEVPIFQAGFGTVTSVELAAAVSNAGAMGALGTMSARTARQRVSELKSRTQRPFLINIVVQLYPQNPPDFLPIALDAGAPIIQFSWGTPSREAVAMIRRAQAKIGIQAGSRQGARAAIDAGADFLICQGTEAGGHVQSHRSLYELLPEVLEEAGSTPVVAAGGIANGAGIHAALKAGASAALLGTRFVATLESNAHQEYKSTLLGAQSRDTA